MRGNARIFNALDQWNFLIHQHLKQERPQRGPLNTTEVIDVLQGVGRIRIAAQHD
jgi:hypothetical protein